MERLEIEIGREPVIMAQSGAVTVNPFLHTLLLGKSRTGKSTGLLNLILGVINGGYGCGVIDPHGPLVDAVLSNLTPEQVRRVILIDPTAPKVPGIGYFNPHVDPELSLQYYESMMDARAGKNGGPRTSEIYRATGRAATERFPKPTILHVSKMINNDAFAEHVMRQCGDPIVRDFHNYWYGPDVKPKDRHDAFGAPRNKIDELMQPGIREMVCQPDSLDWARMMDERRIVLVRLKRGEIGGSKTAAIGNLAFMNMMLAAFGRRHPEVPWPIVMDESHVFFGGIDVETAVAEAGKCGTPYIFADQNLTQLRDEERRIYNDRILLGNCSNILSWRVSGTDAEVLAREFADEAMVRGLVRLDNYTLRGWLLKNNSPTLTGVVNANPAPLPTDRHVPFENALRWAYENVPGGERKAVDKAIMAELRDVPTPEQAPRKIRIRNRPRADKARSPVTP